MSNMKKTIKFKNLGEIREKIEEYLNDAEEQCDEVYENITLNDFLKDLKLFFENYD